MKKVIAMLIAAMMVVSMIPVMAFTASAADVDGMWTTYRTAADYDEPEEGEELEYKPAPGYEYTNDGFHMISPDFTGTTPFGTIQSKDKQNIQDGVYMELRVDDFSFTQNDGSACDQWICLSLSDTAPLAPGSANYGSNWLVLIRYTPSTGKAILLPHKTVAATEDSAGAFLPLLAANPEIDMPLDDDGKPVITWSVVYDGTNYIITICDTVVTTSGQDTAHINSFAPEGDAYVGVTFHSGALDGVCEATITNYGTDAGNADTPSGSDSAEPEDNLLVKAPIADSSTVEAGKPCLIFDANKSSWKGAMGVQSMELNAQGDGSFKVDVANPVGFFQWAIKNDCSYEAADFPVIAILYYDPNYVLGSNTVIRYCAGKNMTADDVHTYTYDMYAEENLYFGDDSEYTLVLIDMKDLLITTDEEGNVNDAKWVDGWNGRINAIRFDFGDNDVDPNVPDPEHDFFYLHYAAIFRSVEEAQAYGTAYMDELGVGAAEDETDAPSGDEQDTDAAAGEQGTDAADVETDGADVEADGTKAEADGTNAEAGSTADTAAAEGEGGCASVIGMSSAIILAAAAAAVVLKKKD